MDRSSIIALAASALLAFLVRFLNVILAWLSRVLGVVPPAPIPTDPLDPEHGPRTSPAAVDPGRSGTYVVPSPDRGSPGHGDGNPATSVPPVESEPPPNA